MMTCNWGAARTGSWTFVACASLCFLAARLSGQLPAGATRIDLDQAIELAIAHNHALKAAQTQIEQSRAEEITAAIRPNPVFDYDDLFVPLVPSQFNSANLNTITEFDVGLTYTWERGHKRKRRVEAARDQTAVTRYQVDDTERGLVYNVSQQFIQVLLAKSNLDLAREDLKSFQQTVDLSEERYKAGAISEGDLLKIKIQLLQFQTDVSSAELALVQAKVSLRQLLGYESVPADFDVIGDLTYVPLKLNKQDVQMRALQLRPDYLAAVTGVKAAQSQHQLARANGYRSVSTTLDYTHVSAINSASFIFNMEIPIFDRNQGEIARTHYAITQAEESRTSAQEQVMTDVANAYEQVDSNGKILQLFQSGYLKQSQDSRDISEYAYKRGAASLLDFLDAERSYRATQLAYRQSLANYMLSLEQLRESVGTRSLP
jgi:outer membrane protein, heavy metal efflux system